MKLTFSISNIFWGSVAIIPFTKRGLGQATRAHEKAGNLSHENGGPKEEVLYS